MKNLLLILLCLPTIGFGQSYHKCISGDCENGYGIFLFDDGYRGRYIGTIKGEKYEGNWKDGYFHGEGTYTYSNGDVYIGNYIKGYRDGNGTLILANGDKYVGEFKNDNRDGLGTYTYADGRIEQGEWEYDRPLVYHLDPLIPESYSLEQYCPKVISQGQNPFCATYAISTIATIIYAKEKGITEQIEISKNRFSPTFLHYIFPESKNPKKLRNIGKFISHYGLPFMKDFEGMNFDGNLQEGERFYSDNLDDLILDFKRGGKYPIGNCSCLKCLSVEGNDYGFMNIANETKACYRQDEEGLKITSLNEIKEQIYLGNPCLYVDDFNDYFHYYKDGYVNMDRDPYLNNNPTTHAVVIIGYDDNLFGGSYRILNSWGEDWGLDGTAWIRYKDIDTISNGLILSYDKGYRYNKELSDIEIKTYFMNLDNPPTYKKELSLAKTELDTLKAIDNCKKFLSSGWKPHGADREIICRCFVQKLENIHNVAPLSYDDLGEVTEYSRPGSYNNLDTEYKVWGDVIWDCWNEYMDNLD